MPASLDFERTFDAPGEPAHAHYVAEYRLGGTTHRLEVWRDGERRIRRRTDDALETYLEKPAGSDEWTMTVLDFGKRVRTDITRTDLMRIGHFTDWFAQGHSLTRPRGDYTLTPLAGHATGPAPIAPCRWYRLTQGARVQDLCWSARDRLALVIADPAGRVEWRVTDIASGPLPAGTFRIDDRGFVRNDADADIRSD